MLRYSRNANSQSEPTAKSDFNIFKQPSLTELHFSGFKSNFLFLVTGVFRRGMEWMVTNLAKHHCHFSPGQGEDKKLSTYYPAIYFSLSLERPVLLTPRLMSLKYCTQLVLFIPSELCPAPIVPLQLPLVLQCKVPQRSVPKLQV